MRSFLFSEMGLKTHYHRAVTSYLDEILPNRWVGPRGFVEYPPCSPDLTPLGFFLWGYLKDKVYATKSAAVPALRVATEHEWTQIPNAVLLDVCGSIASRCQECLERTSVCKQVLTKQLLQVHRVYSILKMKCILINIAFVIIQSMYILGRHLYIYTILLDVPEKIIWHITKRYLKYY